jgi:type I restriction-modification system DNA methylase subunit
LSLPEEEAIDQKIKKAMEAIEEYKPELKGVLPQEEYFRLTRTDKTIPKKLLKNFSNIPRDADGDMFGQIYEYFLGKFALAEGQGYGNRSQCQLLVDQYLRHFLETHRPGRPGHGKLCLRCPAQ